MIFVWAFLFNIWTFFLQFQYETEPFSLQSPNCLRYFDFLVLISFGSIFLVLHIFLIWRGKNVKMHKPLWFGFINRFLILSIWCYWLMKFEKWWNWSFHWMDKNWLCAQLHCMWSLYLYSKQDSVAHMKWVAEWVYIICRYLMYRS